VASSRRVLLCAALSCVIAWALAAGASAQATNIVTRVVPPQSGPSAFEPYLSHLLGQPVRRLSAVSGENVPGSSPSSSGSGVLGCLGSKDWAVRRAAADAVRAAVLLLGPRLEPAGCWGLGDPGSLTQRCLGALDACRFDKVHAHRRMDIWESLQRRGAHTCIHARNMQEIQ
jgi:hypothetical protein